MDRAIRRSALLAGIPAVLLCRPARAQGLVTLTVAETTRSASDWGLEAAQRLGYFTANGVSVETVFVGQSSAVALQLAGGSAEVGSTSTTQVVEANLGGAALVQILRNVTTTPYTVFGRKGMTSVAELRGKTIMVGGVNDITRVFMDRVLAAHRLTPRDVTYTFAGGPAERYGALVNGTVDATLFNPPVTFRALDDGYPILDQVTNYFPRFPTNGFAVRADWARGHRAALLGFLRGFQQGVRWVYDPANRARALQILEEVDNVTPDVAARTYDLFVRGGLLSRTGRFEPGDFAQVLDALVLTKQLAPPLPPPARFYDNSYIDAATASLK